MKSIYEIPGSLKDLFDIGETSYKIVDYSKGMDMDNIEAMIFFLERVGVPSENIHTYDGTQVFLTHPDFNHLLQIDCSGMGDFFSHLFEVSIIKEEDL